MLLGGRLADTFGRRRMLDIRSYLDTARKHGKNAMDALYELMLGSPWQPPAPALSP